MNFDQIIPVIYLIGVLILVLPSFLHSNSKLKQLLANLSIWVIIVLIVTTISYFLFIQLLFSEFIAKFIEDFYDRHKKRAVKTALFEFCFGLERLHSHTYYANTHLFKKFIEKFIEETPQIESKQKDDFIEEWS